MLGAASTLKPEALKHVCKAVANTPRGLHVQASSAIWSHKGLGIWDISLTLQARFWFACKVLLGQMAHGRIESLQPMWP